MEVQRGFVELERSLGLASVGEGDPQAVPKERVLVRDQTSATGC